MKAGLAKFYWDEKPTCKKKNSVVTRHPGKLLPQLVLPTKLRGIPVCGVGASSILKDCSLQRASNSNTEHKEMGCPSLQVFWICDKM